jgi:branched-chain amino acid transport system ATP-binding protein
MLALGRGLMALPRLLMVDEPFLGLAPGVIEQMKSVFQGASGGGHRDLVHRTKRSTRAFHGRPGLHSGKRASRD